MGRRNQPVRLSYLTELQVNCVYKFVFEIEDLIKNNNNEISGDYYDSCKG